MKRAAKKKEDERNERGGGKNLWRLHINCTSSGALVNSIPGTCWSAIHMIVPCYLISSSQKNLTP